MVSEMIHPDGLVHDDVIDGADTRRGKVSVNKKIGEKMSVLAGDYILSCVSQALEKAWKQRGVRATRQSCR